MGDKRSGLLGDWGIIAGIALLVALVAIAILTLMGPAIGNTFSNVINNLPQDAAYGGYPAVNGSGSSQPDPSGVSAPEEAEPEWEEAAALPAGQRLIIKSGEIALEVEDTRRAVDQVAQIAAENGGYVISSQTWQDGPLTFAALTIAVRAEDFDTAMRRLRDVALTVQNESSSGEDVSEEYVDLDSRLRNLQATQQRLRAFLDESATVEEALSVNQELEAIEAEIEQVKGRMNYLSSRSAFSTIAVSLSMPPLPTPTPQPTATPTPWSIGTTFDTAVDVQSDLLRWLAEGIVWLTVVVAPYAIAVASIGVGVRWVQRRTRHDSTPTPPMPPPPTVTSNQP